MKEIEANNDPDAVYCEYLESASNSLISGEHLDLSSQLRPDLRRAGELLQALRAAAPKPAVAKPKLGQRVGRYEIISERGFGGSGSVFEAFDPSLNRSVALKVLHPALSRHADWSGRFQAEGPALAKLRHQNVVQVFEAGQVDGFNFLVMELLPGPDLHSQLASGPLATRVAAELVAAVADGLAHAHDQGILHRDVKPANVLLSGPLPANASNVKLADFGLAAPLVAGSTGLTATGEMVGTPNYLAPETIDGKADVRSDVYGLGTVLYECLTGRPPFSGSNTATTLLQVLTVDPAAPRAVNADVPRDLDTICLKCLEKLPEHRYASAAAVAADLQEFLAGRPIAARPPGLSGRAAKWVRRQPIAATALAVGIVGITTGLLGWAHYTQRLADSLASERAAVVEKDGALALATRRADQVATLNRTLTDIFADFDPSAPKVSSGEPLAALLAPRLVAVGQTIDADAVGDAVTAARFQNRLAHSLCNLGRHADAIELARKAHTQLTESLGEGDLEAIESGRRLTAALYGAGRRAESRGVGKDLLERAKIHLGPTHRTTLAIQNSQALGALDANELPLAIELFEKTLQQATTAFGPQETLVLNLQVNLSFAYSRVGQAERALTMAEQVLASRTAQSGPEHPDTLHAMKLVAGRCMDTGRTTQAVELFEAALPLHYRVLGEAHTQTIDCLFGVGAARAAAGRKAEAGPPLEEALRIARSRLGPNHTLTVSATARLALQRMSVGDPASARPLLEQALVGRTAVLGRTHPDTLVILASLTRAYQELGRPGDAEPLATELHALRTKAVGAEHPDSLRAAVDLGRILCERGKTERGLALLEQAVRGLKARHGANHSETLSASMALGTGLVAAGKPKEAIALLTDTLQAMTTANGAEHPRVVPALCALAAAHRAAGQFDEAGPLFDRAATISRKPGTRPYHAIIALDGAADWHDRAGRSKEAEMLMRSAVELQIRQYGAESLAVATARTKRAACLFKLAKNSEAERELLLAVASLVHFRAWESSTFGLTDKLVALYAAWDHPAQAAQLRRTPPQLPVVKPVP